MKGKRKGNGDVSCADNIDSEFSKSFEWKGLKTAARSGALVLERSHSTLQPPV